MCSPKNPTPRPRPEFAAQGDTIAAVATGSGRAGIGVIRVSGNAVPRIAKALTRHKLPAREAHYIPFVDDNGVAIDVGIAIRYEAPHSFTGEHVLELQGHGGPVVLDLVLAQVIASGARQARPGEFMERAFLNDKLDLAQAEAIADLIDSSSASAARAAVRSMSGEFSKDILAITEELIALRAWLEAALDFSEEDIDFLADPQLQLRAEALIERFANLLSRAEQGRRLRDGLTIVIAGNTNVGKSSLMNALSGADSAIVTDIAGTTRDVLHEHIHLDGIPLHIIDTAGLRNTEDVIEREGISRAHQAMRSADHVLVMVDASTGVMPEVLLPESIPGTWVLNKLDLLAEPESTALTLSESETTRLACYEQAAQKLLKQSWVTDLRGNVSHMSSIIPVAVKTGYGLGDLRQRLLSVAGHDEAVEGSYSARRRHLDALQQARESTEAALLRLTQGNMPELAAEELRLAQLSLDTITGKFDSDDLLGRIFSQFCIGK